jgi:hypothetical protein
MGKPKSGHKKRKEKEKNAEFLKTQEGAMDKFVRKKAKVSSGNQSGDVDSSSIALAIVPYIDPRDGQTDKDNNVEVEQDHINLITPPVEDVDDSFEYDIFDPRHWDSLVQKQIDILAVKGPRRDKSIKKGPKDRYSRRFSALCYTILYLLLIKLFRH